MRKAGRQDAKRQGPEKDEERRKAGRKKARERGKPLASSCGRGNCPVARCWRSRAPARCSHTSGPVQVEGLKLDQDFPLTPRAADALTQLDESRERCASPVTAIKLL